MFGVSVVTRMDNCRTKAGLFEIDIAHSSLRCSEEITIYLKHTLDGADVPY